MSRQIVTQIDIERSREAGEMTLRVADNAIITAAAQEYAQQYGVSIRRGSTHAATTSTSCCGVADHSDMPPSVDHCAPAQADYEATKADYEAVKAAVIERLGMTPPSLESVLQRVLG